MKALLSKQTGGPDSLVLEDVPDPVAGPGEVLIAVRACGVNFPDALLISRSVTSCNHRGRLRLAAKSRGSWSGSAQTSRRSRAGDRVIAMPGFGRHGARKSSVQRRARACRCRTRCRSSTARRWSRLTARFTTA